jgi:hypothetical protein
VDLTATGPQPGHLLCGQLFQEAVGTKVQDDPKALAQIDAVFCHGMEPKTAEAKSRSQKPAIVHHICNIDANHP